MGSPLRACARSAGEDWRRADGMKNTYAIYCVFLITKVIVGMGGGGEGSVSLATARKIFKDTRYLGILA